MSTRAGGQCERCFALLPLPLAGHWHILQHGMLVCVCDDCYTLHALARGKPEPTR